MTSVRRAVSKRLNQDDARRAGAKDRYRLSFGSVAEAYERARPLYAVEALEWLQERLPLRRVLDVGAGTGKLSRQLGASVPTSWRSSRTSTCARSSRVCSR